MATNLRRDIPQLLTSADGKTLGFEGAGGQQVACITEYNDSKAWHAAEHAEINIFPWDDLFVIIGQSNADGRGVIDSTVSAPVPNVLMLDKGGSYKMAEEPIGAQVSGWINNIPEGVTAGTPAHSFGLEMGKCAAHLAGVRSLLIPCAIGSTGFKNWLTPDTVDDMTTLFGAATARARASQQRSRAPVFVQFGHEGNSGETTETLATGVYATTYAAKFASLCNRIRQVFPSAPVLYAQLSASNTGSTATAHRRTGHVQQLSEDVGAATAPTQVTLSGGVAQNTNSTNTVTVTSSKKFRITGDGSTLLGYKQSGITAGVQYAIEFTVTGSGSVKMQANDQVGGGYSAGTPSHYSLIFTGSGTGGLSFYRESSGNALDATITIYSLIALPTISLPKCHMVVTHDVLRQAAPDDLHLATAGYKEVGRRFALAYAQHVLGIPGIDGTGPRLVSITSTDGTHTKIKFTQKLAAAKSGEENYSDGTNSLFRVYDGGTEKSVSSVAIDGSDDTALIITHASCSGVRVVTYGDRAGQDAVVRKGVVYNTDTQPLPAPMFGPVVSA